MVRALVSLPEEDKAWLDRKAKQRHTAFAALVREAVDQYRHREEEKPDRFEELQQAVRGIWKHGDSVKYVRKLRAEWER